MEAAVDQLATPIEQVWAEELKRSSSSEQSDDCDCALDAQSGLMDLWFGVIHAAKKSPWDDESDQSQIQLVRLLEAFKSRPSPAFEEALYSRRDENWLYGWSEGKLWENLSLFGLAIAESRNDGPDRDSGCTGPEVLAFLNVNAFMARMTVTGVREAWDVGMCFMAGSTEGQRDKQCALDQDGARLDFRVVLVWLIIAGKDLWERCCRGPRVPYVRLDANVHSRKRCPWARNPGYNTEVFAKARWRWWKGRFGLVAASKGERWSCGTKLRAREIQLVMEHIESDEAW